MAGPDTITLESPACPFLGLVDDRRTRFTYPHPAHRCYANGRPATTDATRQAGFCLSRSFTTCDRYLRNVRSIGADRTVSRR